MNTTPAFYTAQGKRFWTVSLAIVRFMDKRFVEGSISYFILGIILHQLWVFFFHWMDADGLWMNLSFRFSPPLEKVAKSSFIADGAMQAHDEHVRLGGRKVLQRATA